METWFIVLSSICIAFLLKALLFSTSKKALPPGPATLPLIVSFIWLRRSSWEIEPILRGFRLKYGPLITLRIGSRTSIFVASHALAHRALVQNGAVFADRPKALPTTRVFNSDQHNISSAAYGPTWRLLRRNLTSGILHPSRVKSYSQGRRWTLHVLVHRLLRSDEPVRVMDHFQYAIFCLLVLMCFGDKLDDKQIQQIESVQRRLMLSMSRFRILNFWPRLGKIVFRNRWKQLLQLRQDQEDVLIPLVKARISLKAKQQQGAETEDFVVAYVDTLVDLQLPEQGFKRKLTEGEMVSLCSEFLNAGTDTTSTALEWIIANLVKYPEIQARLYEEIVGVKGPPPTAASSEQEMTAVVEEEDVHRMPYLKAVVLESLRRHPPGHFVLPHSVTEEVELEGHLVPKNATVNFMVAEMGWDPKVWEEPMEFKPERFLNAANADAAAATSGRGGGEALFDITGSREIKMMPFGAGRRICPGSALALLHLEYFVANLVWYFKWTAVDGDDVDLSEKQLFTVVMKNPLQARISPRG
ncbi:hypothetical protein RJ640_021449 [Escallonia rubra]|uniref:Cytochrome P450 89A2 n=1 Tax=Escallonia rubra TaxID=112253 RepID=A0AA88U839_9ASTE|nr:hypothetical protein RJ640_021449 [Escallonia rubra]